MIARHWTGLAQKERANEYIAHLQNDTFKQIAAIDGFISAGILKRELNFLLLLNGKRWMP